MAEGAVQDYESRDWRDRVEGRFARHGAQIEHLERQHGYTREDVANLSSRMERDMRDLSDRVERDMRQLRADLGADIASEAAQTRLLVNERLVTFERGLVDRLDLLRDEMTKAREAQAGPQPPPAPAAHGPLPWRLITVGGALATGMVLAIGITIGVTWKLSQFADLAGAAVTP